MMTRPNFSPNLKIVVCIVVCAAVTSRNCNLKAADQLTSGTSARQIREQSLQAIPFDQLTPQIREKITPVLERPSIYRRLPITSINVDPDYFLFLVRYPEVVVNIWQLMGITKMTADRTGPFALKTNDGAGAISDVELIYGTNNLQIYYAEGNYSGPLLKRKLQGQCVLVLRTNYQRGPGGAPQTVNSLDVFLKVENVTASLIAKTLNPIVGAAADHNFVESLNFVERLNETTEKNGIGVQRMADRLTNLTPGIRDKFVSVAGIVYERNRMEQGRNSNSLGATYANELGYDANMQSPFQRQTVVPPQTATGYSISDYNPSGLQSSGPAYAAGNPADGLVETQSGRKPDHYRQTYAPAWPTSRYPVHPAYYQGSYAPRIPQVQYSSGYQPR